MMKNASPLSPCFTMTSPARNSFCRAGGRGRHAPRHQYLAVPHSGRESSIEQPNVAALRRAVACVARVPTSSMLAQSCLTSAGSSFLKNAMSMPCTHSCSSDTSASDRSDALGERAARESTSPVWTCSHAAARCVRLGENVAPRSRAPMHGRVASKLAACTFLLRWAVGTMRSAEGAPHRLCGLLARVGRVAARLLLVVAGGLHRLFRGRCFRLEDPSARNRITRSMQICTPPCKRCSLRHLTASPSFLPLC
jgi:hypothetical protein